MTILKRPQKHKILRWVLMKVLSYIPTSAIEVLYSELSIELWTRADLESLNTLPKDISKVLEDINNDDDDWNGFYKGGF